MTEFAIRKAYLTDVGRKRSHNEDFVGFFEPPGAESLLSSGRLYIVADGVGGASAGEVASKYAVQKVLHAYYQSSESDLAARLTNAIGVAHAEVFAHTESNPALSRMGTTLVAAVVHGDRLVVANVGDSRAYLIRDGQIRQITRDHSLVARLVEEGIITAEQAETHPRRNVVLRSMGTERNVHADVFDEQLQPGDQVLLCSDGLTGHLSDAEILQVATRDRPGRAVRHLVKLANERGGRDNISVLVLRLRKRVPAAALARRARREQPVEPNLEEIAARARHRKEAPPPRRRLRACAWLCLGTFAVLLAFLVVWLYPGGPDWLWRWAGWEQATPVALEPATSPPLAETAIPTPEPSGPPTPTPTNTVTPSPAPTTTPTVTPTATPANTSTAIPTDTATPTDTAAPTATPPRLGETLWRPADGMTMIYVPAGTFEMGSTDGYGDEQPVHSVTLDGFWIDRTEVTNTQFAVFLNAEGNQTEAGVTWLDLDAGACLIEPVGVAYRAVEGYGDHPAIEVTWYAARAYCAWAGGRLATEAEWEYVARGPEGPVYPWGDEFACSLGNFDDETAVDPYVVPGGEGCDGYARTAPVGTFPGGQSWCGAVDMAGNVWEWVSDRYGEAAYARSPARNPPGPSSGAYRVLRGGGWLNSPDFVRSAERDWGMPGGAYRDVGFRCARDYP